jgi:hypothetical protein
MGKQLLQHMRKSRELTNHSDRVLVSLPLEDQDPSVRVIDIEFRSNELGGILHDESPVAV